MNEPLPDHDNKVSCIILAGGEGKRVGGVDKGLLEYKGKRLIEHVIKAVSPQVDDLVISANRNTEHYRCYTDKVISDETTQYLGPLAGISAALAHCKHDRVLIVPCDTPFLPQDIIEKFLSARPGADIYIAEAVNKLQPVMLIHKNLHNSIRQSLEEEERRLMFWVRSQHPVIISFPVEAAFKNFNHSDDFAA
jgi:molybdopterin-guanine dinucleotide biosynthesis protein A